MEAHTAGSSVYGLARANTGISWDVALQTPPPAFYPSFGPLPAVVGVQGQPKTWDRVGYTRTLLLSDGSTVVETITGSERGASFGYDLTDFTKLFGRLVSGAHAEWTFVTERSATKITWSYEFHTLPGRGWLVNAIVSLFWARYMRRVLPRIIAEIEAVNGRSSHVPAARHDPLAS